MGQPPTKQLVSKKAKSLCSRRFSPSSWEFLKCLCSSVILFCIMLCFPNAFNLLFVESYSKLVIVASLEAWFCPFNGLESRRFSPRSRSPPYNPVEWCSLIAQLPLIGICWLTDVPGDSTSSFPIYSFRAFSGCYVIITRFIPWAPFSGNIKMFLLYNCIFQMYVLFRGDNKVLQGCLLGCWSLSRNLAGAIIHIFWRLLIVLLLLFRLDFHW